MRKENMRNSMFRGIIENESGRREKEKNKTRNEGPNLKFKAFLEKTVETKLNGAKPTEEQTEEIIENFLNEKENEGYKGIYTIELIKKWIPDKYRDDSDEQK